MAVAIPSSEISFVDGGLGIVGAGVDGVSAKIGVCSSGVAGTTYTFRGTDTASVVATLGSGPLVDAVIEHLIYSKGKTVYAHKATATTAGTSSAVTASGGGPTVSLTGAPYDQSESIIEIVAGGAVGTSTFRYSLDGGDTYSDIYATTSTYLLPSGVTANFAAGTYVADETYSWTDTAPAMTTTNVGTAFDALIVSPLAFEFVHVVGQAADASAAATMAATISTKITSAHAAKKYIWAMMEAPAVDKAGLITSFASVEDKWLMICGGFCELAQQRNSTFPKRSIARLAAPRIARNPLSVHIARNETDSDLDAISGIVKLVPDGAAASTGYHDEDATPGLNAARFTTARTIAGRTGFYFTNGLMLSSLTSDFQQVQYVRILLAAARTYYAWSLTNLASRIRKNATTGYIAASAADSFELAAESAIKNAIGQHIDGLRVLVNRTDDLSADPTLRAKIRLVGPVYALELDTEMGLAGSLN